MVHIFMRLQSERKKPKQTNKQPNQLDSGGHICMQQKR